MAAATWGERGKKPSLFLLVRRVSPSGPQETGSYATAFGEGKGGEKGRKRTTPFDGGSAKGQNKNVSLQSNRRGHYLSTATGRKKGNSASTGGGPASEGKTRKSDKSSNRGGKQEMTFHLDLVL